MVVAEKRVDDKRGALEEMQPVDLHAERCLRFRNVSWSPSSLAYFAARSRRWPVRCVFATENIMYDRNSGKNHFSVDSPVDQYASNGIRD